MVIEIDGDLWAITYFQHVKPGKGGAFVRTKLKNVLTGNVVDRTYRAGEKVNDVRLERRPVTYSYTDGALYYFMDANTFDMIPIAGDLLGADQLKFLKENMECEGLVHGENVISVELPQFVELQVTQTDPGFKGDTAQGATKPATLETGAVITVPLFVEEGDVLKIDRREEKYLSRVNV
jgi:elongation factor P